MDQFPAEMRPYEPTWRDRLAALMMGDGRASPARRNMVEGLLGSTGLGTTGANVADFTPLGIPMMAQEARRDVQEGDYLGAAVNAMGVMPAAKLPAHVAKQAAGPGANKVIKAYHGSPHDFDKFDLSKIGTGEGAQAYGHGLYFADNADVARGYRDGVGFQKELDPAARIGRQSLVDYYSTLENKLARMPAKQAQQGYDRLALIEDLSIGGDVLHIRQQGKNGTYSPEVMDWFEKEIAPNFQRNGRLFEVNIHADPAHFLDWDKPVAGQPANELLKARDLHARGNSATGSFVWGRLTDQMDPREAAAALRDAGIPGIRYLDAGSRGAGKGTSNYVVFNDAIVEIARKYGIALPAAAALYYGAGGQAEAAGPPSSPPGLLGAPQQEQY